MTGTSKALIVVLGLFVASILAWISPLVWLLYIVALIWVLASPNKADVTPSPQQLQPQAPQLQYLEQQLQQKIANARNDDVREGLQEALVLLQQNYQTTPPQYVALTSAPQPYVRSESDIAADKQKQELRNINTILYIASFLLVGAAILFIGLSSGVLPVVKFTALLLVAIACYVSGIVLHCQSTRLRPAAIAFVGTGLALLPFVGLAFYNYVYSDGPIVWWLTSAVGLLAFVLALLRIQSVVLSYLTLAFVFSLATSSVSVLHVPFVGYFVAIIIVSSLLQMLAHSKPQWVPKALVVPLGQNAQLATPVTLIGTLFLFDRLSAVDYSLITGVSTVHYLVSALGYSANRERYMYWLAARANATLFVGLLTYVVTDSWSWVWSNVSIVAVLQHFYSIVTVKKERFEEVWLWGAQSLMALSVVGLFNNMSQVSAGLIIVMLLSAHQLYAMKRVEFAAFGIFAAVALPLTIMFGAIQPALDVSYVALVTSLMAVVSFVLRAALAGKHRSYQYAASLGYALFLLEAIILAAATTELYWAGTVMLLGGVVLYIAAFIERAPLIHIASNFLAGAGILVLYIELFGGVDWALIATGWTLAIVWYALRWYFEKANEQTDLIRRDIMAVSAIAALGVMAMASMMTDDTIVAAALTGCVAAALLAGEGYVRKQIVLYEGAVYFAAFCMQRLVAYTYPDASILVYSHWWAAVIASVALMYYRLRFNDRQAAVMRGIIALAVLSIPTGLYALIQPANYQLLFLMEHIALAVAGLATNKKLLVQWGAIGVGLALLWTLKGYTYVILALLALGLIGLAMWRLMKKF